MVLSAQNFMNFYILGEIGKKVGIVARRVNAQSYLDLFVYRYNHNKMVGLIGVVGIVIILGSYVVAQFVGGARLFESMTGQPYWLGLTILPWCAFTQPSGDKGRFSGVVIQGLVMTARCWHSSSEAPVPPPLESSARSIAK